MDEYTYIFGRRRLAANLQFWSVELAMALRILAADPCWRNWSASYQTIQIRHYHRALVMKSYDWVAHRTTGPLRTTSFDHGHSICPCLHLWTWSLSSHRNASLWPAKDSHYLHYPIDHFFQIFYLFPYHSYPSYFHCHCLHLLLPFSFFFHHLPLYLYHLDSGCFLHSFSVCQEAGPCRWWWSMASAGCWAYCFWRLDRCHCLSCLHRHRLIDYHYLLRGAPWTSLQQVAFCCQVYPESHLVLFSAFFLSPFWPARRDAADRRFWSSSFRVRLGFLVIT